MTRVVVVGGGVAGLAAAWELRRAGAETVLVEASERLGGKIATEEIDGLALETGAEAFLDRTPEAFELAEELGLDADVVPASASGVKIAHGGRLHDLPDGLVLGAPSRLRPLLRSGLISPVGAVRAGLDLLLPREADVDGRSVGELVRRRFGSQVAERLVEPLLTGVYAGDIDQLGAAVTTPMLADAARARHSILLGLRERPSGRRPPRFHTFRGGMSRLVERLGTPGESFTVRVGTPVDAVERIDGRCLVRLPDDELEADGVVVGTPAFAAADLLKGVAPVAAEALDEIPYVSVAVVTVVYDPDVAVPDATGILVARDEEVVTKAVTFVSNKWDHVVPDGRVVLRASIGRRGDEAAMGLDDEALVGLVRGDLADLAGIDARPRAWKVTRWERALPQYEPAHRDRLARVAASLERLPGIEVAGAAYEGMGVPACIAHGRAAARAVLAAALAASG
ncbi:MAG: protoporphyrinogen oxidase [Nitriliruptorales bacterium]